MTADLLKSISRGEDRDYAPFFAGRKIEVDEFEWAIERSREVDQTQFRIFQGAPGCGKTSLLAHFRETGPDNRVFVAVDPDHLTSRQALMGRINAELHDSPSPAAKRVAGFVRYATQLAGMSLSVPGAKTVGGAAGSAIERDGEMLDDRKWATVREQSEVVLLLDEAQCLDKRHEGVLRSLHTTGLGGGLHSVFAFAGLSHTGLTIRRLEGLSRLSQKADVNMGMLARDECVDSTRQMLERCVIEGTSVLRENAARKVAAMSERWPQHLACAQAALARELLRVDRDLTRIDFGTIERETTADRHADYRRRIEDYPVLSDERFTALIVNGVHNEGTTHLGGLIRLCRLTMDAEPEDSPLREFDIAPSHIANTLIEKGVLSKPSGGAYEATIPSMAKWLQSKTRHDRTTAQGGGASPEQTLEDRS